MGLPIKKERLFFVGEIHELPLQSFRELDIPPVIEFNQESSNIVQSPILKGVG